MSSYRDKINTEVSLYYSFDNPVKRSFEIKKPKQIYGTPIPKVATSKYVKRSKPKRSYSIKKHKLVSTSVPTTKYMSPRYVKPKIKLQGKLKRSYDVRQQSIKGSAPGRMTYNLVKPKSKSPSSVKSKSKVLTNNTLYTPQDTNVWYGKQLKNQVQPRFIGVQLQYPRWAYKIDKRAFVLKKNAGTKKRISEFKKL